MGKLRAYLLVTATVVAVGGAAYAADLGPPLKAPAMSPAPVANSWTGCYVGAQGGWGWGRSSFRDDTARNVFTAAGVNQGFGLIDAIGSSQRTASVDEDGGLFGGQIGCDYQFSGFLIGISASGAGADINGSALDPYANIGPGGLITAKTDFLADVSGRLGATWNQTLFYAKGGVAWSHNQYIADTAGANIPSTPFTASDTATGALAGGGIEWAFLSNWTAFVEYDHYFFDSKTLRFSAIGGFAVTGLVANVDVKQSLDVVKAGVNYHFNFGGPFASH